MLVNNCYSGVEGIFTTTKKKFWEKGPGWWDTINDVGLKAHFIASQYAVRGQPISCVVEDAASICSQQQQQQQH